MGSQPQREKHVEQAIQIYAAVNFFVIGLSHVVQPRVWAEFFILLRGKGYAGVFVNGFLSLSFGSIIVGFHNVWSGLPIVLTLLGWAQVVKGLISFVAPQLAIRGLNHVSVERAWEFQIPGALFIPLAGLIGWCAWAG